MTKDKTPGPRRIVARRWALLGTATAAGLAVTAPAFAVTGQGQDDAGGLKPPAHQIQLATSQGGEGGEGGEGAAARPGAEDAEFLADLGYLEGHLRAGVALYEAGAPDMAKAQIKRPDDQIYEQLKPGIKSRHAGGFSRELRRLAKAVGKDAPVSRVRDDFVELLGEIAEVREHVGGGAASRLAAVVLLVRGAADAYANGVQDGRIVGPHEYQDAWGFVQAAQAAAEELVEAKRPEVQEALAKIREQFAVIAPAFPALVPDATTLGVDPSVLYGAAARMEIASLAVK